MPSQAGVYYLWSESNELLYIGKGSNIRNRILFQFSNRNKSARNNNICEQARDITWEITNGELSALILSVKKITELRPTFNRKRQVVPTLHSIVLKENEPGWLVPEVISVENIIHSKRRLYRLFTSVKKAKNAIKQIIDKYCLCHYAANLEKTSPGPCTG